MRGAAGAEPKPNDPARPGDVVAGRYCIEGHLGRGASGVVYAARDQRDETLVALKIIHPELCHSRQVFGRYKREASILRLLQGERIVKFLDFVEHEGLLAIALEFVPGASLEAELGGAGRQPKLKAPVEPGVAVELVTQICEGLTVAHEVGIVHRDLKPANIMIAEEPGGALRVRILDFGLAKVVHGEHLVTGLTERDMIFGTPEYMAPEQARGDDVDARCDIYSCGVMLYEMVTGQVPIKGSTPLATMTAQLVEVIESPRTRAPNQGISAALEAVILRALDKDPAHRYRSAKDLASALEATNERRVISMTPRPTDDDLHAHDTELSLRRSQIKAAGGVLEEAERIARARRPGDPAKTSAARAAEREMAEPAPGARSWLWPAVSVLAVLACVAVGVLLALK